MPQYEPVGQPVTDPKRRNRAVIGWAVVAVLLFFWWRTTEQWTDRGCSGPSAARYALTEGEPEWYQSCTPRPRPAPAPTPSVVPEPMHTMKPL